MTVIEQRVFLDRSMLSDATADLEVAFCRLVASTVLLVGLSVWFVLCITSVPLLAGWAVAYVIEFVLAYRYRRAFERWRKAEHWVRSMESRLHADEDG